MTGARPFTPKAFRYYATVSAPGFCDTFAVWAPNREAAIERANADGMMPWRGWPPRCLRKITISDDWDCVVFQDGQALLRRDVAVPIDHLPAEGHHAVFS